MRVLEFIGALIVAVALAVGTYNVLMFLLRKAPPPPPKEPKPCTTTEKTMNGEEGI